MKKWIKICFIIFLFALVSFGIYLILKAFNIANLSTLRNLITKSGKYSILVYTLILTTVLIFLCFVPYLNIALTILGVVLFGSKIAYISNLISVAISTSVLFVIGDKLGEKFARKIVGEKGLVEAQNAIDHKSKFWLPLIFIAPGIPDEAICLVAGMTKMKYGYLLLVSLIYHSIEIGLCCFIGGGLIDWSTLSIVDWIVLINVVIIDIYLLVKLEKFLENKRKIKK